MTMELVNHHDVFGFAFELLDWCQLYIMRFIDGSMFVEIITLEISNIVSNDQHEIHCLWCISTDD